VPLALLESDWLAGRTLLMLEPRRIAARAVAQRMAQLIGESVGQTVGIRTRLETRVSRATRIEVVTEGILTRMLQSDPALEHIGCVIFDEFHERSLNADLGLALCLESQETLREDLRVLVMSATLDTRPLARLLDDAPIIEAHARSYEVTTHYVPRRAELSLELQTAQVLRRALADEAGDILCFLPGAAEIGRVRRTLEESSLDPGVSVLPLYGELDAAAQDAALRPSPAGRRKIVLATSIAETSLTIEGVRVVVDSGLRRYAKFDPATGMSRLETEKLSQAAADQRRGRAGRLSPGACYRLWSEGVQATLVAQTPPEILHADLAPLALELACWGAADAARLRWLDPPPPRRSRKRAICCGARRDGRGRAHHAAWPLARRHGRSSATRAHADQRPRHAGTAPRERDRRHSRRARRAARGARLARCGSALARERRPARRSGVARRPDGRRARLAAGGARSGQMAA
jgi:ATP-dependent helicase HrpB